MSHSPSKPDHVLPSSTSQHLDRNVSTSQSHREPISTFDVKNHIGGGTKEASGDYEELGSRTVERRSFELHAGRGKTFSYISEGGSVCGGRRIRGGGIGFDTYGMGIGGDLSKQNKASSYSLFEAASGITHSPGLSSRSSQYLLNGGGTEKIYNAHPVGYSSNPFRHSSLMDPRTAHVEVLDPNSIEDDGDDGLEVASTVRKSILSVGRSKEQSGGGASSDIVNMAGRGSLLGRMRPNGNGGLISEAKGFDERASRRRRNFKKGKKLLIAGSLVFLIMLVVIIGTIGGIIGSQKGKSRRNFGVSAAEDERKGYLTKDSKEIIDLMNNKQLKRVFAGIDYTPINAQYPECLTYRPSQNNVTRDVAILSRLTKRIRLYGTDCNQTQMVINAIDRLGLQKDMRLWMGVWLDSNKTTNERQLRQMYEVLENYDTRQLDGIVIGNEILFRKDMTEGELGNMLTQVRKNLTARGINLPVATSEIGSNWSAALTRFVDVVMSNIHPFFGGVKVEDAASWTWTFWKEHVKLFTVNDANKRQIISELGWPSGGGSDCSPLKSCPKDKIKSGEAAIAGIAQMNRFMKDWLCTALNNSTQYFWFEAFDEPWKIRFNRPGKAYEDKWGIFDVNRNLKKGIEIPECNGRRV